MLSHLLKRLLRGASEPAPPSASPTPAAPAAPKRVPEPAELRAMWERELARDPLYGPAHAALAELDAREGRLDAAIAHYLTVVARFPDEPELLNNLGALYIRTGAFEEAIVRLGRAVARKPDFALARDNLASALLHARRFAEAEAHERELVARSPDSVGLHFRLAHTLLMQGKLDEGWAEYEWRRNRGDFNWGVRGLPAWDGAVPEGKAIRVIAEQGLGDAILFARFVSVLAARCARVQVLVREPLERLFRASFTGANVSVTADRFEGIEALDAHVHLLSLPLRLGLGRDALHPIGPYLHAPDAARAHWQPRIAAAARPRIGIVWAGNPERRGDESRSIPPEALAPLAQAVPEAAWVSLQAGLAPDAPRPFAIALDPMGAVTDYADTAAIIEALDLVVSVDTSVAHAAAALGKPLILLAPHNVCWRWDMDGVESPWYRGVQVFRARGPGDWGPVVAQAAAAIRAHLAPAAN